MEICYLTGLQKKEVDIPSSVSAIKVYLHSFMIAVSIHMSVVLMIFQLPFSSLMKTAVVSHWEIALYRFSFPPG